MTEPTPTSSVAYISASDLAIRWDVCRTTVLSWCKAGLIPGACKIGPTGRRCLHFPQWRIPLQWVAEGERKPVRQVQKEIAQSIKRRKKKTWDKMSERLEKRKSEH